MSTHQLHAQNVVDPRCTSGLGHEVAVLVRLVFCWRTHYSFDGKKNPVALAQGVELCTQAQQYPMFVCHDACL